MAAEDIVATIVTAKTNGTLAERFPALFNNGKIRSQLAYFAHALEADSTVKIARLPIGASILGFLINHAATTGAVTAMIGDSGDADRYVLTAGVTSMAAAGKQVVLPRAGDYTISAAGVLTIGTVGFGYRMTTVTDIILTTETANITGAVRVDVATIFTVE